MIFRSIPVVTKGKSSLFFMASSYSIVMGAQCSVQMMFSWVMYSKLVWFLWTNVTPINLIKNGKYCNFHTYFYFFLITIYPPYPLLPIPSPPESPHCWTMVTFIMDSASRYWVCMSWSFILHYLRHWTCVDRRGIEIHHYSLSQSLGSDFYLVSILFESPIRFIRKQAIIFKNLNHFPTMAVFPLSLT